VNQLFAIVVLVVGMPMCGAIAYYGIKLDRQMRRDHNEWQNESAQGCDDPAPNLAREIARFGASGYVEFRHPGPRTPGGHDPTDKDHGPGLCQLCDSWRAAFAGDDRPRTTENTTTNGEAS